MTIIADIEQKLAEAKQLTTDLSAQYDNAVLAMENAESLWKQARRVYWDAQESLQRAASIERDLQVMLVEMRLKMNIDGNVPEDAQ